MPAIALPTAGAGSALVVHFWRLPDVLEPIKQAARTCGECRKPARPLLEPASPAS